VLVVVVVVVVVVAMVVVIPGSPSLCTLYHTHLL
jgi:hypothetical protein